jgi:hypothetical protein
MNAFLPFLLGFAMFATLAILVVGLIGFARNGPFYKKHANNLMRARVIGQGVALILFALIIGIRRPRGYIIENLYPWRR